MAKLALAGFPDGMIWYDIGFWANFPFRNSVRTPLSLIQKRLSSFAIIRLCNHFSLNIFYERASSLVIEMHFF